LRQTEKSIISANSVQRRASGCGGSPLFFPHPANLRAGFKNRRRHEQAPRLHMAG